MKPPFPLLNLGVVLIKYSNAPINKLSLSKKEEITSTKWPLRKDASTPKDVIWALCQYQCHCCTTDLLLHNHYIHLMSWFKKKNVFCTCKTSIKSTEWKTRHILLCPENIQFISQNQTFQVTVAIYRHLLHFSDQFQQNVTTNTSPCLFTNKD